MPKLVKSYDFLVEHASRITLHSNQLLSYARRTDPCYQSLSNAITEIPGLTILPWNETKMSDTSLSGPAVNFG